MSRKKKGKGTPPATPAAAARKRRDWVVPALLSGATFLVFSSVTSHEFVALDDNLYVTENPHVKAGLGWPGVRWAFTTFFNANWHPLTWLSHMADVQFHGLHAGGHLLTSLALHILSACLLYLALRNLTQQRWQSALVAGLFAVHPLHVESVAWVSERKDVLSGFFWMLALLCYSGYVRDPEKRWKYAAVLVCFALGLMAKPMLVSLPFVLLLLDYWPLKRLRAAAVREKIPMFAMAIASGVITYIAQKEGGAVQPVSAYPIGARIGNAIVSYSIYALKTLWPARLSVFYPYSRIEIIQVIFSAVALCVLTVFVVLRRNQYPYLFTGWFWYGGMLVPVIGIVQVGEQAMADRYTYLPLIGLFIAAVWGISELTGRRPEWRRAAGIAAVLALAALGIAARAQVSMWQDSIRLFEHAAAVTPANYLIENNWGYALYRKGELDQALVHLSNAVNLSRQDADARINLGLVRAARGELPLAAEQYREALKLQPGSAIAHFNLGVVELQGRQYQEALASFQQSLALNPDYAPAHMNLGMTLLNLGRSEEALGQLQEAIHIEPGNAEAHNNYGNALASVRRYSEARREYALAVQLDPGFQPARRNLEGIDRFLDSGRSQ